MNHTMQELVEALNKISIEPTVKTPEFKAVYDITTGKILKIVDRSEATDQTTVDIDIDYFLTLNTHLIRVRDGEIKIESAYHSPEFLLVQNPMGQFSVPKHHMQILITDNEKYKKQEKYDYRNN